MPREGHTYPRSTATWTREQYEGDDLELVGDTEEDKGSYTDYPD